MSAPQYGRPMRRPRPQQPTRAPSQQPPGIDAPEPSGAQPRRDERPDTPDENAAAGSNAPATTPRR